MASVYIKVLFVLVFILFGCAKKNEKPVIDSIAYKTEIDTWHDKRITDLKGENGWLNLAGLFWLKEGINTFGSGEKNDVVFPKGKIAERAGFFTVNQGVVKMEVTPLVTITQSGKPITNAVVFSPDSTSNPKMEHGSLRWFIIKRDKIVGVRLRDLESDVVQKFHGIQRYQVDPAWRVEAFVEQSPEPRMISITNVLGQTTQQVSPGTLVFTINEKEYRLDALLEGDELFIIFGDPTNEQETYPSGRYVYAKKPNENGKTILDFNKAYNPPCAFTSFATCPLPPVQNILSVAVTAGEKNYQHEKH